jgi:hypothetical protein
MLGESARTRAMLRKKMGRSLEKEERGKLL